jgi:hypothetical protein
MKLFRPKFTDRTLFGQIQVCSYNLTLLKNTLQSKFFVHDSQKNLYLPFLSGNLSDMGGWKYIWKVFDWHGAV